MSKRTHWTTDLIGDGRRPLFLDLAASIIRDIERGRLKPGDRLPGTRTLAKNLGINRNTVDAAFQELTMQGWLSTRPARGTFVADDLPVMNRARTQPESPPAPATIAPQTKPIFRVTDGSPDTRLMPNMELARAFRHVLASPNMLAEMSDGDPYGAPRLRDALAHYLREERGVPVAPSGLIITRGSQMALFLAAAAIIKTGEVIAVEEPGYPLAWAAFRAAGAQIIGVPVDDGGIDIDRLEALASTEPALRAVYVTPHHQYPTTVTLGAGRRLKLLDLMRRHNLTLIEDDYDHEYRFDGRPLLPLAARAEADQSIIYIGSLSKLIAPALRLGYAVARPDITARMAARREAIDRQGDFPLEQALAMMIEDGEIRRHARKARAVYQERRNIFVAQAQERLGGDVLFDTPAGGLAIWLKLRAGLNAEIWAAAAADAGLLLSPGVRFMLGNGRPPNAFRIGYATLDQQESMRVIDILAQTRASAAG